MYTLQSSFSVLSGEREICKPPLVLKKTDSSCCQQLLSNRFKYFQLEQEINRQRIARKWYLIVIVLLYVGLLASFSLNVSLLLRKPQTRLIQNEKYPGEDDFSLVDKQEGN